MGSLASLGGLPKRADWSERWWMMKTRRRRRRMYGVASWEEKRCSMERWGSPEVSVGEWRCRWGAKREEN